MQLSQVRPLFPVAERVAYLNHAAVSPLATPTRAAMEALLAALNGQDALTRGSRHSLAVEPGGKSRVSPEGGPPPESEEARPSRAGALGPPALSRVSGSLGDPGTPNQPNSLGAERGPAPIQDWQTRFAKIEQIRAQLAAFVGAAPSEIAFTKNTSEGLAILAEGLDWRPGDRIVSFECEFPANLYPWLALRPRGVRVELLPEAALLDPDRVRAACRGARLLALSQVQYLSGLRADLAAFGAICRETGTLLAVDAIQGLGAFPVHVKQCGIHALSTGSHKWLMGPEGAGFLFLDGSILDQVQPREVGWLSVAAWDDFNAALEPARSGAPLAWRAGADRFECGMRNCLGIYGLGASVALLTSVGIEAISAHLLALGDRLADGLRQRGCSLLRPSDRPEHRSGINSFRPRSGDAASVVARLEQLGIICAPRGEYVRCAPHLYNNAADVDRLLEALS